MSESFVDPIAQELTIAPAQVAATLKLLAEGATVPFIARYRKEATGTLDEVAIAAIRDRAEQLATLQTRRESILKSLDERKLLTDELKKAIGQADTLTSLEDIYLPYRPKRRTRGTIARDRGLAPLAELLLEQTDDTDPIKAAEEYVDAEKEVPNVEDALAGARDIIAENISTDKDIRAKLRKLFLESGTLSSKVITGKETEGQKFKDYFEWEEPVKSAPSHRILAIRRGEKEMVLFYSIRPEESQAIYIIEQQFLKTKNQASEQVRLAIADSYKRLLAPSMETESRLECKKRADEEAIKVFADNIKELLLSAPLGQKTVLAIDPGFRTGCKTVCLDRQGNLLFDGVIFPDRRSYEAEELVKGLVKQFKVEAIAIGNGTAGRETETFCRKLGLGAQIPIVVVNESGASIYSASEVARDEFPDKDITVRGAVSIGRRLMDPLAELVKIDPKSIGVGQYQHDVDQNDLKRKLDDIVMSCVNAVGVEVNTASKQLLAYVSGIGPRLAEAIVNHRKEHGPFKSRKELLKVAGLGPKAFEQAAGFLRIRGSENPLDASAVHPERYPLVETMAQGVGASIEQLLHSQEYRRKIRIENYISDEIGLPTLKDIQQELERPGRDPREAFESFSFTDGVEKPSDLTIGMKLPGIVTNVTAFGAFVDVGVHQDGLVHVSQLADKFVKDPNEVVKVHQKVQVTVTELDLDRNRISLSMRSQPELGAREKRGTPGGPRQGGGPRRDSGNQRRGGAPRRQSEGFGGNWFEDAMKKKGK